MFRGARTFIAGTIEALRNELNRFAGDVHERFRALTAAESNIAALQVIATTQESTTAGLGPGDPLTFTAEAVTPQKSGNYLAIGVMSGTIAAGTDTIEIALSVDGTTVATADVPGTAVGWSGSVFAVVTLAADSAHIWSLQAATFGGVLSISSSAGNARIVLVEL